ncbi:GNAT family N-acetyltransferase [Acholeplasma manati]|uniref:GNAT family N-acetyltransferase n=1 Tax=Paracholeplasma manati TaxID=591373 RepID=A0ABT2YBS8_9MOLU|nr:GNAT family N-acetyltransferase [Paracholeplasma manati]MCV2232653.1 GNAT family N-acetyltransferase [Paracholeplasma manati]
MHHDILNIIQKAKDTFTYHSFHYVDEHDVKDYEVVYESTDGVLLKGIHPSQQKPHLHFFVHDIETLKVILKPYPNHLIEFVPKDWMLPLEQTGYIPYSVLRDYWYKYQNPVPASSLTFATPKQTLEIALLSQSRTGSSRAFSGETVEVVSQWVTNQVDGVDDSCVLIHQSDVIEGAVMVGLYGENEKRTLWVRLIVVKASLQNQGIGQKLLSQALYYGQMHYAKRAFLMADDLNQNALYLYQKMGFKPDLTSEQIDMISI